MESKEGVEGPEGLEGLEDFPMPELGELSGSALERLDTSAFGAGSRSIAFWLAPFYEAMMREGVIGRALR